MGTYYCPRCSPRCPHCSGDMCRDGTWAPTTPRAAPRAWEVPPLMERAINFPPGEWPPLSRSSPTQTRVGRRPVRRAAPAPSSRDEPPLVALRSAAGIIGGRRLPRDVALGEVGIDFVHQGHVNPPGAAHSANGRRWGYRPSCPSSTTSDYLW